MIINKINPEKKVKWIFLTLVLKIILCIYLFLINTHPEIPKHFFGKSAGDTFSYLYSMDNLLETGTYSPYYRMPGVGVIYFLFRLLFIKNISLTLFVLFQIIYDALATYFLAHLAFKLTKSKLFFIITYLLAVTNSYYSVFSIWLLSESICTSSLIFSVYFFYKAIFINEQSKKALFLSGLFATWAIFCRPIYIVVLPIYIIYASIYLFKTNKQELLKSITIFIIPFIFFDALWVFAGYKHNNEIHFLQQSDYTLNKDTNRNGETYHRENWEIQLINYVCAFGGDAVAWNPDSEISWFHPNPLRPQSNVIKLPKYAFANTFNEDSLWRIRNEIQSIHSQTISSQTKDSIKSNIDNTLTRYIADYKEQKPFHYYIISRIIIFKKLIFQQPTYNLYSVKFIELNIFNKLIKTAYMFLYFLYLFGFVLSFYFMIRNKTFYLFLPIIILIFFGILIYPYLRFCEFRYIAPIMPFILFMCSFSIYSILKPYINENGKNTLS